MVGCANTAEAEIKNKAIAKKTLILMHKFLWQLIVCWVFNGSIGANANRKLNL
jgi:hypothetical protein